MSSIRNCLPAQPQNYPSAPSSVKKDPRSERSMVAPFDTDSWAQKASMRDSRGSVIPEREIYQNPKREIRDYPIPLWVDNFRVDDDDSFSNGRINLEFSGGGNTGIIVRGEVRNIKKIELSGSIRVPIVDPALVPELNYYNRFSLEVCGIGTGYNQQFNNNSFQFQYLFTYEVDPQSAGHYLLSPEEKCFPIKTQDTLTGLSFVLRTPNASYPLPKVQFNALINIGSPLPNPIVFIYDQLSETNLQNGDDIQFICPNTRNRDLNNLISQGGPYTATNVNLVDGTFETSPPLDGSSINLTTIEQVQVLVPKNRIFFGLILTGMKY